MAQYLKHFLILSLFPLITSCAYTLDSDKAITPLSYPLIGTISHEFTRTPVPSPTEPPTLVEPTSTTIPSSPTYTYSPTTTPFPRYLIGVRSIDLFPADINGFVVFAAWNDNAHLSVAYNAYLPYSPEAEMTAVARPSDDPWRPELLWLEFDNTNKSSTPGTSPFPFDLNFWDRNQIIKITNYPELYGYFSPSGKYVIYNVWHGSVFDQESYTDIIVADTQGSSKTKIFHFGYSNVYLLRAQWTSDENHVYFTATYEGPAGLYAVDLTTGTTVAITEITDWDGIIEDTFRLSPDNTTIASINYSGALMLVSLIDGSTRIVSPSYSSNPRWAPDGRNVYYWWGADWDSRTEFRSLDVATGESTIMFDAQTLGQALRHLGLDVSIEDEQYFVGGRYAISPDGKNLFLWQLRDGPFLITIGENVNRSGT